MTTAKRFCGVMAAAALSLIVAGGGHAEIVYHRGNAADPETLDPHKTSNVFELNILSDLLEGLVTYDAAGTVSPGVAKAWDISDDGTVYTFHFRDDARWSNGEPVTAEDFVFSLRRVMTPETSGGYASLLYPIKNAEAVKAGKLDPSELAVKALDDKTLEITLEAPTPYFIETLKLQPALPVYPPAVKKYGDDFVKPGNMVSNGAYKLKDFTPNARTTVVKNPYFHDAENVAIDKVIFYPTEDQSAALRRFIAGELDSNWGAPVEQISWMREHLGRQLHITPSPTLEYYAIKVTRPPFDDARVRKALSMAVNRKFLADEIMHGAAFPAYSFVPPGIANYGKPVMPDYANDSMLDREDEAITLMKQAGYGPDHPLKLELSYITSETQKQVAIAIAGMYKTIGVDVTLVNRDSVAHHNLLHRHGVFDIAQARWVPDYIDAQNFLFLRQSNNPRFNYQNYSNPNFDALMAEAAKQLDANKRKAILHEAQAILEHDGPDIPLLYHSWINLVSGSLKGFEDNISDIHLSRYMSIER
ncbi:MAG: peptide ABC transporter substrate-binding protein [Hyphomicrobiales bacterium]